MKIYLDTCSLQRPLDSKTQVRIVLEAEAVLGILALVDVKQVEIVSSEALQYEITRMHNPIRREYALDALSRANKVLRVTEQVELRARRFNVAGFHALDALHLALAEVEQVDYFCTCDDRLLKKARILTELKVKVVSPIELIEELEV
ncbi:MAG: PIN domain-containing protein [Chloroflexota bacterium]